MEEKPIVSRKKLDLLKQELTELTNVRRKEVALAIEEARSHGDLKENAEYHEARENQARVEDRIRHLEYVIKYAQVAEAADASEISVGTTIRLKNLTKSGEQSLSVVGSEESDILQGLISHTSPLAKQLLGKKVGEVVTVTTPAGEIEYEVLDIQLQE